MYHKDGWWIPDGDKQILEAVKYEWSQKSDYALSLCKNRDMVVQAGANIGYFPVKLSRVFNKVVSFEPFALNIEACKLNLTLRGVENVSLYEAALGDTHCGVSILEAPSHNCGAVTVGGEGSIPSIKLDDLDLDCCDLVWLDVEGYEWKAILGSLLTIEKYKPVIILENKGLIPGFGGDFNGSEMLRRKMIELGYCLVSRMMRDDFYVHKDNA